MKAFDLLRSPIEKLYVLDSFCFCSIIFIYDFAWFRFCYGHFLDARLISLCYMLVLDVKEIGMGFLGEISLLKTLLKYLSEGICKGCSFLGDLLVGFVSKVSSLIKDC